MKESIYKEIFLKNVSRYGRNHLGVDIVDLYKCKDGTILAISSNYKFTVVSEKAWFSDPSTPYERVIEIENKKGLYQLSSVFKEDYDEVNKSVSVYGFSIDELLDLKCIIKEIFVSYQVEAKYAFEWVKDSPLLSFKDFENEIYTMLKKVSYTRDLRNKLRDELLKESV